MTLWRENMQIPKKEQERKEAQKRREIIRTNSFYVAGSGKKYSDYIESPENRRAAGISIQNN